MPEGMFQRLLLRLVRVVESNVFHEKMQQLEIQHYAVLANPTWYGHFNGTVSIFHRDSPAPKKPTDSRATFQPAHVQSASSFVHC